MTKKRILIISPYFVPCSTPDMQRVRMSLPYYDEQGWEAEVICVDPKYTDLPTDELMFETIPQNIKIHRVAAFTKEHTMRWGLGSIALRSLYHIHKKALELLQRKKFDLVYFSTTQFPICILGRLWKRKLGIPYVIDMQDPWHTDYYKNKPKAERPKKYWFSYWLNKWLEPYAMRYCDGLMAVSEAYLDELNERYPNLQRVPQSLIPFGYSTIDFELAAKIFDPKQEIGASKCTLLYAGVLINPMKPALQILFNTLKESILFKTRFQLSFKGTSYATKHPEMLAQKFADKYELKKSVQESPQRLSPFETIHQLQQANGLVILGTDDPSYVGSKILPYLLTKKPILAILHSKSYAAQFLKALSNATVIYFDDSILHIKSKMENYLKQIEEGNALTLDEDLFATYSAKNLSSLQVKLFERVFSNQYL